MTASSGPFSSDSFPVATSNAECVYVRTSGLPGSSRRLRTSFAPSGVKANRAVSARRSNGILRSVPSSPLPNGRRCRVRPSGGLSGSTRLPFFPANSICRPSGVIASSRFSSWIVSSFTTLPSGAYPVSAPVGHLYTQITSPSFAFGTGAFRRVGYQPTSFGRASCHVWALARSVSGRPSSSRIAFSDLPLASATTTWARLMGTVRRPPPMFRTGTGGPSSSHSYTTRVPSGDQCPWACWVLSRWANGSALPVARSITNMRWYEWVGVDFEENARVTSSVAPPGDSAQ